MMNNEKYAKAYTEVVEIISHFPKEEYEKIPEEKIEFYKNNMDKNYIFKINPDIDLAEQNISKEANAIIIMLYKEYFATEEQKEKIDKILAENSRKEELEKSQKYNPDDLFKKRSKNEIIENAESDDNNSMIEYKENFFTKLKKFIFKLLHI